MNDSDGQFVHSIARRIVGEQDAADVAQDTLLLAHRHRDAFRGDSSYRTWLYRIATTTALTHLRRQRRRRMDRMVPLDDQTAPPPDERYTRSPEEAVATAEAARRVSDQISALAPAYRDVLRLRFEHDLSEAEVARRLNLSLATVKIRTHRGRHAVKAALAAGR